MLIFLSKLYDTRYYYDTVTTVISTDTNASYIPNPYEAVTNGYLIDAYQFGTGVVVVIKLTDTTISKITYPNSFFLKTFGEGYNYTALWFSIDSKQQMFYQTKYKTLSLYYSGGETYNGSKSNPLPFGTVITSSCIGTTSRVYQYLGLGLWSYSDTANSGSCGYITPLTGTRVTVKQRIKRDRKCYDNPFLLVWKNKLGGWDNFMFSFNQIINNNTKSIGSFEVPYTYLTNVNNNKYSRGKDVDKTVTIGADQVTTEQVEVMAEHLLTSQSVYWVNEVGKFTQILVQDESLSYNTNDALHTITLTVELPKRLTIQQ